MKSAIVAFLLLLNSAGVYASPPTNLYEFSKIDFMGRCYNDPKAMNLLDKAKTQKDIQWIEHLAAIDDKKNYRSLTPSEKARDCLAFSDETMRHISFAIFMKLNDTARTERMAKKTEQMNETTAKLQATNEKMAILLKSHELKKPGMIDGFIAQMNAMFKSTAHPEDKPGISAFIASLRRIHDQIVPSANDPRIVGASHRVN